MPRRCRALRPWSSPPLTQDRALIGYCERASGSEHPEPQTQTLRAEWACPAISRNGCYGIWIGTAASVRLDAGELHHFGPLLGFAGEEKAEVGGWAGQHRSTHVGQPRLRLGVGEDCIDLHVEPR